MSDDFEILVIVSYEGKEIDSRVLKEPLSTFEELGKHGYNILVRKNIIPSEQVISHRVMKWLPKFNKYADLDGVEDIKNGDQIGIFTQVEIYQLVEDSMQLIDETSPSLQEDENISVEQTDPYPPSPTPPPTNSVSVAQNVHTKMGYTYATVPEKYRKFLFSDGQRFPMDEVIDESKESEAIKTSFTEIRFSCPNFDPIKKMMIGAAGDWLLRYSKQNGRAVPCVVDRARMAFSIWAAYPWYGSNESEPLPWTKTYDPIHHTGPLEYYINRQIAYGKRMTRKAEGGASSSKNEKPSAKVRKTAQIYDIPSDEVIEGELRNLSRVSPDDPTAIEAMKTLLHYRRREIHDLQNMTAEAILAKYPSFIKCPELIITDFEAEMSYKGFPKVDCVIQWDKAVDFLLAEALGKQKPHPMQSHIVHAFGIKGDSSEELNSFLPEERSQLALLLLPCLLMPSIHSKQKAKQKDDKSKDKLPVGQSVDHLFQFKKLGPGRSIKELIEECKKDTELTQPFLLALGADGHWGDEPSQIFLVVNFRAIQLPTCKINQAVHYLFATFFTLNVEFPVGLTQVYMFLEKLFGVKSSRPSGRAADLYDRIVASWKFEN